ncbi:MAG: hypothetical protein JETT_0468 [Candidatus Jettenia ecosi]|uniref:Uncharacterized protein n=1 Tax=Candidatus Jettenia ecosi TaxID=2494326 RepID=A0A533QFA5_9BACT|nr:MAG: hypothetical protein JETT_0468 [Candidatus Jettenia ecosi]
MEPASAWNSLEMIKLVFSTLTPLAILLLGIWTNIRLRKFEQDREADRREKKQEREEQKCIDKEEKESERQKEERACEERERLYQVKKGKELIQNGRIHIPHIEFTIQCIFFGPQNGMYIAEFILNACNRGCTTQRFPRIMLRVLGIRSGERLSFWEGNEPRLRFPEKILETAVIPKDRDFILVEPGIKHDINFTTIIPHEYRFIIARAEFHYEKYPPQSTEKVFELPLNYC